MCGIFGIFGHPEASIFTALGLHALQHRGQEAVGIVAADARTGQMNTKYRNGIVRDTFQRNPDSLNSLLGTAAVGHVRYSTAGGSDIKNAQPLYADLNVGKLAIAHNGNLTNARALRHHFKKEGHQFHTSADTEVLFPLIARNGKQNFEDRLIDSLREIVGAYSLIILRENEMIVARDPHGVRPLCLGKLDGAWVVSSESVAFQQVGAEFVRDIAPGEVAFITKDGIRSTHPLEKVPARLDVFEYIYFAMPNSVIDGRSVSAARHSLGRELAKECGPIDADFVIPIQDSGTPAAIGFAEESGIPLRLGIIRSKYMGGRTFIEPTQTIRDFGVRLKHSVDAQWIKDRKVVLVDDSIVRGTTSKKLVDMVREAGATKVTFAVSSPPVMYPNFYGIDTPSKKELIAGRLSKAEICATIGADALHYLTVNGMYRAMGEQGRDDQQPQFEDSVFTGDYPIPLVDEEMRENAQVCHLPSQKQKGAT